MTSLPLLCSAGSPGKFPRCEGLPLREVTLEGRIEGLIGWMMLTQVFANEGDMPVEPIYIFPLPDRAAVTGFVLEVGGKRTWGELRERGKARQQFRSAKDAGKRAALAEEERPDVFTVTVGNVMPGDRVMIQLSLVMPLGCSDGEAFFRFPLLVPPRYAPGTALPGGQLHRGDRDTDRVPDASRLSPPRLGERDPRVRFSCSLWLDPRDLGARDLRASLPMEAEPLGEGGLVLRLAPGEAMDRDLLLRFCVGGDAVQSALLLAPGSEGDGHFALTLVPPAGSESERAPRDVVVVLDRSGSMQGWKMTAARRAAAALVRALRPTDRFAVLAFDDHIVEPPLERDGALAPATERNVALAERYLDEVTAGAGTEMAEPLERAVAAAAEAGERRGLVVLITDGHASNEDELLGRLGEGLARVTLCAIGIDIAVSAGFLTRLSSLGGGWFEQVESVERLEQAMERAIARMRAPVMEWLEIEMDGLVEGSATPARLPSLYAGLPLVVLGRYAGDAPREARVVGESGGEQRSLRVVGREAEGSAIRPLWARGRIRDLEDSLASGTPLDPRRTGGASYEEAIVATSLEGRVLSRLTAFVAVDERLANRGEKARPVAQPVERPAGWGQAPSPRSSGMTRSLELHRPITKWALSSPGLSAETFRYLVPEKSQRKPLDQRSVVFSLGLLLHEMLLGWPYRQGSSLVEVCRHFNVEPPDSFLDDPALAALDAVLVRSLQLDPAERFADAAELLAALRSCAPSPEAARPALAALVQQRGARELASWQAILERAARGEGSPVLGSYLGVVKIGALLPQDVTLWLGAAPEPGGGFRPVELQVLGGSVDRRTAERLTGMARVVHPSFVELIEVVEAGPTMGLVYAVSASVRLSTLLSGALPPDLALLIACDLASGAAWLAQARDAQGRPQPMLLSGLSPGVVHLTPEGLSRMIVPIAASGPDQRAPFRSGAASPDAEYPSLEASRPTVPPAPRAGEPAPGPLASLGAWLRRLFRG